MHIHKLTAQLPTYKKAQIPPSYSILQDAPTTAYELQRNKHESTTTRSASITQESIVFDRKMEYVK